MSPERRALELAVERALDWEQRALAAEALLSALSRDPADARAEAAAAAGDPHPCARTVREAWLREARERVARREEAYARWYAAGGGR